MDILIVMCIGILVGRLPLLRRMKKKNEGLSLLCTFLLIFAMGVMLGEKENFFEELSSLGFTSFLFFLLPTGFSIILVYYLTKVFMKEEKNSEEGKRQSDCRFNGSFFGFRDCLRLFGR